MGSSSDIYFMLMVGAPPIIAFASLIASGFFFAMSRKPSSEPGQTRNPLSGLYIGLAVVLLLIPLGICGCYGYVLGTFEGR